MCLVVQHRSPCPARPSSACPAPWSRARPVVRAPYTIPPILFFLLVQRRMVRGLVAGAVKG